MSIRLFFINILFISIMLKSTFAFIKDLKFVKKLSDHPLVQAVTCSAGLWCSGLQGGAVVSRL